jgi:hypothetical protein
MGRREGTTSRIPSLSETRHAGLTHPEGSGVHTCNPILLWAITIVCFPDSETSCVCGDPEQE